MSALTIVVKLIVKEEKREEVKSELLKLIPITKKEKGCIQYDLHQDNENLNLFVFFEIWENRELWQTHMENQHIKDFNIATDGCLEKFVLNEMTLVN